MGLKIIRILIIKKINYWKCISCYLLYSSTWPIFL